MKTKVFEVRDSATLLPVLAVKMEGHTEKEKKIVGRGGFASYHILVTDLENKETNHDPFAWDNSTMKTIHQYLIQHFDEVENTDVIDAEFIRGESQQPKSSEIKTDL